MDTEKTDNQKPKSPERNNAQKGEGQQTEEKRTAADQMRRGGTLILRENSPFIVKEAYKAMRTNIIFSLPGAGCKCIAVTSAGRNEGKTTNSLNLAISFGQIGKKVLLVDADMRLPTVATKLGIHGKPGLSNLLIGELETRSVRRHSRELNIDVIPAGNIPPDPTGLLESSQMEELIKEWRESYDYVFLDLPPASTVADALILSGLVDGFLLLVKHNTTEHRAVAEMISRFRLTGGKILGFIYADADLGNKGRYKKYGYGYGYGK